MSQAYTPSWLRSPPEDCCYAGTATVYRANLWEFGPLHTPEQVAETFLVAATQVGARGGGHIFLPPVPLVMGANPHTAVGADEGAGVTLTQAMSRITFVAPPGSILTPASNRIEMFVQNGATDVGFRGIVFDNSANGALQNQAQGTKLPGIGLAMGNAANCAIRQYGGANLTVEDCTFVEFHTCANYIGSNADNGVLIGTVAFARNRCHGAVFGLLAQQPEHVVCNDNGWYDGRDGILAGGEVQPGHLLYNADTSGAHPYTVTANGNHARNHSSSVLKLRKGVRQVAIGNVFDDVHRGIESHRAQTVAIIGNTIGLADKATDTNPSGIEVTGCVRSGLVADNVIDRSGTSAYGVRLRPAAYTGPDDSDDDQPGDSACPLNNVSVLNNRIVDDLSGSPLKERFIAVQGMTGGELRGNVALITGNVALVGAAFGLMDCHYTQCFDNARRAAAVGTPSGSDRLYTADADCTNIVLGYKRQDLDLPPTGFTVNDDGAGATIVRTDGVITKTWTPVPTFETPGTFAPANLTAVGWMTCHGEMATVGCRLKFDTNAYTGASGAFRITGFPYEADAFGTDFLGAVSFHRFLDVDGPDVAVVIGNGTTFFTLRRNVEGTAGTALDAANLPASTADIEIGFQITLRIQEP